MPPITSAMAESSNTRRSVLKSASSSPAASAGCSIFPFTAGSTPDSVCIFGGGTLYRDTIYVKPFNERETFKAAIRDARRVSVCAPAVSALQRKRGAVGGRYRAAASGLACDQGFSRTRPGHGG